MYPSDSAASWAQSLAIGYVFVTAFTLACTGVAAIALWRIASAQRLRAKHVEREAAISLRRLELDHSDQAKRPAPGNATPSASLA